MENEKHGLVKVESDIVAKGDRLLALTNKVLAPYYAEIRNWWNSLDGDWKLDFIPHWVDEEEIPHELLKQGKIFNRKRLSQDASEWEIILDEKGNLIREPWDFELERIILTRNLSISEGHQDLQPLKMLQNLRDLGGNMNRSLRELSGIEELTTLREIDLRWSRISDLEALRNLTKLEKLNFYDSDIKNLDPLYYLHELTDLNIGSAFGLTDLSPLSNLSNLFTLNCSSLSDTDNRIDFSPISKLPSLEKLRCEGNYIENLDFLKDLRMLEWLNLENTFFPNSDTTPLGNLKNLIRLRLSHTNVNDISPLVDLPTLEYLWVEKTQIPEIKIQAFSKTNPNCTIILEDKTFIDGTTVFYRDSMLRHEKLILN